MSNSVDFHDPKFNPQKTSWNAKKLVHYINDKIYTDVSDRILRNFSKKIRFKFNFPVKKTATDRET